MRKDLCYLVGLIVVLLSTQIVATATNESYDPWMDLNDDGIINVRDLQLLSSIYSTSGEPMNKTERLLQLEARIESLNASLLTDYYNKTESDLIFVDTSGDTIIGYLDVDAGTLYVDDIDDSVGIGTTSPNGTLHIVSTLNAVGTIYELPSISSLPDPSYNHEAVIELRGGEEKFGKWRQYFNGYEQSWALTYNAPWNYEDNSWAGRDSGDPRANVGAFIRFNVAEGDSGRNTFEINFARGGDAGTVPDWNDGAWYYFYDGSTTKAIPAELVIRGAANMDAVLKLVAHETVDPSRINLRVDGVDEVFSIERVDAISWIPSYSETVSDLLAIKTNTGNVGIGTRNPNHKLEVVSSASSIPLVLKSTASDSGLLLFQMGAQANTENSIVSLTPDWAASKDFAIVGHNLANIGRIKLAANTTYITGNVGIKTSSPAYPLDVEGYVQAYGYYTGDIIFQKDNENLWRIFEDERGLYLENLKNGKVYSFVLRELGTEGVLEFNGTHLIITEGVVGFIVALGLVFGVTKYKATKSKEEADLQQSKLSLWQ